MVSPSFCVTRRGFEELVATRTSVAAASSMAANLNFALGQNANESPAGSDGSAASGRGSDLSEWLRSVSDAGVRAKESTGHRNRNHRHRR